MEKTENTKSLLIQSMNLNDKFALDLMYKNQLYHEVLQENRYVLLGSVLSCQYGTKYARMDIIEDYGVYKGNLPVMTCIDCKNDNIHNFGSCMCPESNYKGRLPMSGSVHLNGKKAEKASDNEFAHTCVPIIKTGWKQLDNKTMIDAGVQGYAPMLLDNAVLVCQYGGIICVQEVPVKKAKSFLVTSQMMTAFDWPVSDEELSKINSVLMKYGIIDPKSIRLFMATAAHEGMKGTRTIEMLNSDGSTVGKYLVTERGAGYIQITWSDTHLKFLATIPDSFSGEDTASYIAQNYPWEASAWFWTSPDAKTIGTTNKLPINEYVEKYGDSKGVYLMTQYAVNSWSDSPSNEILSDIRDGKIEWSVKDGRVWTNGKDVGSAPKGWDTIGNDYSREKTYNEAIESFQ